MSLSILISVGIFNIHYGFSDTKIGIHCIQFERHWENLSKKNSNNGSIQRFVLWQINSAKYLKMAVPDYSTVLRNSTQKTNVKHNTILLSAVIIIKIPQCFQ